MPDRMKNHIFSKYMQTAIAHYYEELKAEQPAE